MISDQSGAATLSLGGSNVSIGMYLTAHFILTLVAVFIALWIYHTGHFG